MVRFQVKDTYWRLPDVLAAVEGLFIGVLNPNATMASSGKRRATFHISQISGPLLVLRGAAVSVYTTPSTSSVQDASQQVPAENLSSR
jgi:hypothetical protein